LVEDNAENRYLTTFLLERSGYRVVSVIDGRDAAAIAARSSPVAILLDIQLPEMDGYSVAQSLRKDPQFNSVPIVAVSAYAMVGDRERALAAGCSGYIEKPIDPRTFVADIEALLAAPPALPP
jgi:CheY-like chemotaxis protein